MAIFETRYTPGNRDNSLPEHYDIFMSGSDDSLFTVWSGVILAKFIVRCLIHRRAIEAFLDSLEGAA